MISEACQQAVANQQDDDKPRVPGTLAIYNVKDCLFVAVGFRGYFGGFPASCVISDSELASICAMSAK